MSFALVMLGSALMGPIIFNAMDGVPDRERDATFWWGVAAWVLMSLGWVTK